MLKNHSISCVLAGYNEMNSINEAIRRTLEALASEFDDYELILVDDASHDDTFNLMQKLAQENQHIRLLPNYVNLNFGTSVLRGLYSATKEYVIYNACDLPLRPEEIGTIVSEAIVSQCDVMVLERRGYKTTLWRGLTSAVNAWMLRIFFPRLTRGTPVLNFVQLFRRDVLEQIQPLARSPIFVWPELVFRAKKAGLQVSNRPTDCNIREVRSGSFGHAHDIIWGIYEMLRFRFKLWSGKI